MTIYKLNKNGYFRWDGERWFFFMHQRFKWYPVIWPSILDFLNKYVLNNMEYKATKKDRQEIWKKMHYDTKRNSSNTK